MSGQQSRVKKQRFKEEVADIEKSGKWLNKSGLKDSTEALTMAAEGHGLPHQARPQLHAGASRQGHTWNAITKWLL